MSHETLYRSFQDNDLRNRVMSAIEKEVWANPTFGDTPAGAAVKAEGPAGVLAFLIWPICIDNEAAYEFAVNADPPVERPGNDPGVITDAALSSGVQTHWPATWPPEGVTP